MSNEQGVGAVSLVPTVGIERVCISISLHLQWDNMPSPALSV